MSEASERDAIEEPVNVCKIVGYLPISRDLIGEPIHLPGVGFVIFVEPERPAQEATQ